MQMIDVLKRLAELDSQNPRVASAVPVLNKQKVDESQVDECGMMGTMTPEMHMPSHPPTPASINMTAGSADELGNLLKDIVSLAGMKSEPDMAMPAPMADMPPPAEPEIGPPKSAADDMRAVIDKLNPMDGDDTKEPEDSDQDGDVDDDPEKENLIVQPTQQGGATPVRTGPHDNIKPDTRDRASGSKADEDAPITDLSTQSSPRMAPIGSATSITPDKPGEKTPAPVTDYSSPAAPRMAPIGSPTSVTPGEKPPKREAYDNTPNDPNSALPFDSNKMSNQDPAGHPGGGDRMDGDRPKAFATFEDQLMWEYKKFIRE